MASGISFEDIRNETADLEKIPVEEVFAALKCTREGLTSAEGETRLHNKLEKKDSKFLKFLGFMWNPLSWVMELAAIMAIALANGGVLSSFPFVTSFCVCCHSTSTIVFLCNRGSLRTGRSLLGLWCFTSSTPPLVSSRRTMLETLPPALMAGLAPKCKVLRDGKWCEHDASILVPGDLISVKLGDIIPTDARLLEGDPLKIDQSAFTGESLPVTRHPVTRFSPGPPASKARSRRLSLQLEFTPSLERLLTLLIAPTMWDTSRR
ncbi:hypothetical protein SASPL_126900 [Salvia splendens]|uniref:Cation-transporting P-type ATPase N-terminal domain-containing protein n=1 Tax=Salvia splendens TaxID=180675 RepID=A0A8X8ZQG1_SALSN|nr:hypothetical protein SASPL_126900 [Salvia splendens]